MSGGGIYGITYNGVVIYVGQSISIQRRFGQHRRTLRNGRHRNFVLQRIFDKHPESLGYILIEETASTADLTAAEQRWMDELKPAANLAAASGSFQHTDESRARMRAHTFTPEHRANLSAALRGKPSPRKGITGQFKHTDETKAKIAEAARGQVIPFEVRSRAQKGRQFSKEHREKLRAAKLGRPNEAVRRAMTGRKQSAELVAKRVAASRVTIERRREATAHASGQ